MSDQIDSLTKRGISAATLNSSIGIKDTRLIKEGLAQKKYKLLYVAPETLLNEDLIVFLLQTNTISCIAIDEAHVISTYGSSFRPKYKKLSELKDYFPDVPIIALTATLNKEGIEDVIKTLKLDTPNTFIHSIDRPSIQYNIFMKRDGSKQIMSIIDKYKDQAGIIYCSTVGQVDEIATYLQYRGYNCKPYHSKLKKKEKEATLEEYLNGTLSIMVATIAFGMGIDKAQPLDTRIPTPNGLTRLGNITVGDEVFSHKGLPTKVTAINYVGSVPSYKVTFNDNTETICAGSHLWNIRSPKDKYRNKSFKTVTTESLIGKLQDKYNNNICQIPLCSPVVYPKSDLPVDPYVLGCLLGDGGLTKSVRITVDDSFIVEEISKRLPETVTIKKYGDIEYGITSVRGQPNPILNELRSLDLIGKNSSTKFIPSIYLTASIEDRLDLLNGLLDTDGCPQGDSSRTSNLYVGAIYVTKSEYLKSGIISLVQSLGGIAKNSIKSGFNYIYIRLQGFDLFKLPRKQNLITPTLKYFPTKSIVSIEKLPNKIEMQCITIQDEDHLYLTNDYIVTHNCDIRFVIHNNLPSSVDAYLQETGRASRDGLSSSAYLLYDDADKGLYSFLWSKTIKNPEALKMQHMHLRKLDNILLNNSNCRRKMLLREFGEEIDDCNNCDVCLDHQTLKDAL